jgi:hypothetical protein
LQLVNGSRQRATFTLSPTEDNDTFPLTLTASAGYRLATPLQPYDHSPTPLLTV